MPSETEKISKIKESRPHRFHLSTRTCLLILFGTNIAYVLAFILLLPEIGTSIAILTILPVVTSGLLFGLWGGLLTGAANSIFIFLMIEFSGLSGYSRSGQQIGIFAIILIGVIVGRMHDLGKKNRLELERRKRMENKLRAINAELSSINEHLELDLSAAARVQQSILPEKNLVIPGLIFGWIFDPSEKLGGDIFNFFRLDEKYVGFYILDASGHGVSAALLSVTLSKMLYPLPEVSTLLKRKINMPPGYELSRPGEVAESLNREFRFDSMFHRFFTLFYGILNLETSKLRYVSAGHPGLIYLSGDHEAKLLETASFPIGFSEEPGYEENFLELHPGDRFFVYTDGIYEVLNSEEKEFGVSRLLDILSESGSLALEKSLLSLKEKIDAWRGGRKAEDDITILACEIVAE